MADLGGGDQIVARANERNAYAGFRYGADPYRSFSPSTGPYRGYSPFDTFGGIRNQYTDLQRGAGPFNIGRPGEQLGAGMYGLPQAFTGWSGPARYSLGPATAFAEQAAPAIDSLSKGLTTDWAGLMYRQSSDLIDTASRNASRQGAQRLAAAGYGGGGYVSPFAGLQVQQENMARAGQLGSAARQAILSGQQMTSEVARNYLNSISQNMQALLAPAQIETSRQAKVPSTAGPNYIGPALGAISAGLNAYASAA